MEIKSIDDVVAWRLCIGCGVCAYVCPQKRISLFDFYSEGIRPTLAHGEACGTCDDCLATCPSVATDFNLHRASNGAAASQNPAPPEPREIFAQEWGEVLEIWEGYATDSEMRFKGSSGGALTALALYCLEKGGMEGVLQVGGDPEDPVRNRTRLSQSRDDLMQATGSRYSPAAIGHGLSLVESAAAPCAIIAKPAEIVAIRKARKLRPTLDAKVGVLMSFFCAESPSTAGTVALLKKIGVEPQELESLRYRGLGWPGLFTPFLRNPAKAPPQIPYRDTWVFLQKFRAWATYMWPDGTGELADLTCGDPWYEKPDGKNPGFSLVVVRTELGRKILHEAMKEGYLELKPAERWKLAKSQPNLLKKKGEIGGRRAMMALLGLPRTEFRDTAFFHCWKKLKLVDKVRSTFGTLQRVLSRRLTRRLVLDHTTATPVKPATIGRSSVEAGIS